MVEAKFSEPKFKDGKILAFADVDLVGGITVKGFRVVSGDQGLFAAVPSRPVTVDGRTRYMNQVVFSDPTIKERFLTDLLDSYHAWEQQREPGTTRLEQRKELHPPAEKLVE